MRIIAGGKIFPYKILKIFILHVQLHLAKKQWSNIQDFINRLQKPLLENFSASAMRWPRYPENSSLKAFVSRTRTHYSSRAKALEKTDRANRGYISFLPLKVLVFLKDYPCLPGILLFFQMKIIFPLDPSWPGTLLNVYPWYTSCWYFTHTSLTYYLWYINRNTDVQMVFIFLLSQTLLHTFFSCFFFQKQHMYVAACWKKLHTGVFLITLDFLVVLSPLQTLIF